MNNEKLIRSGLWLLGGILFVWLGMEAVSPGIDATHSLAWGAVLGNGVRPDILAPLAPLAHPLPIAVGTVLSPLAPGVSYAAYSVVAALSYGFMLYAVYRLASVLAGGSEARRWALAAGLFALVLVMLRPRIEYFALYAVVEVPFSALLLLALSFVIKDPRSRPWLPLSLIAVAGLLRPDSWVLGVLYCAWLAYDGLRGRDLVLCTALALAAPVIWLTFAAILTSDPLSPLTGNPSAVAAEEFGFNESPEAAYVPDVGDAIEKHAGGVRILMGWPIALAGLAIAILALLPLAGRSREDRLRAGLVVGCGVLLFVQTIVLAELGAPVVERYAFAPGLLLLVLVAAAVFVPGNATVSAGLIVAFLAVMMVVDPDKPKQVTQKIDSFSELRGENDDLLDLTERDAVRDAVFGRCVNVYVGGKNRTRSLAARPVVAMAFDRDPIHVKAARAPRGKLEASIFRRDLPLGPPPYESEGVWNFRSACLKGVERKRANRDRKVRERERRGRQREKQQQQ